MIVSPRKAVVPTLPVCFNIPYIGYQIWLSYVLVFSTALDTAIIASVASISQLGGAVRQQTSTNCLLARNISPRRAINRGLMR